MVRRLARIRCALTLSCWHPCSLHVSLPSLACARGALECSLARTPVDLSRPLSSLDAQKAKYKAHEFGSCPRTLCEKQTVLPTGVADTASLRCVARDGTPIPQISLHVAQSLHSSFVRSGENPMKLYCSKCQELYDYNVPGGNYIDGAFFGTTFPHLFFQTYRELRPPPSASKYVPRVFGFKLHKVRTAHCACSISPHAPPVDVQRDACMRRRKSNKYPAPSGMSGPNVRRTNLSPTGTRRKRSFECYPRGLVVGS